MQKQRILNFRMPVRLVKTRVHNEKGIALAMVLVLSVIALAIISALIYLVLQGTKFSGFYKRYGTVHDAGLGAAEIAGTLVANRGNLVVTGLINFPTPCNCGDPDVPGDTTPDTCLCRKLCDPPYENDGTPNWTLANCDNSFTATSNPDMQVTLSGTNANYLVSAKIVDTRRGNSDLSTEALGGTGVASSNSGIIPAPSMPYLYRIEIDSRDSRNLPQGEVSRLSTLYAF